MAAAYVCRILTVCVLSLAGTEPAKQDAQILTAGQHHGNEVPADAAGLWWGLFPKGDDFELLEVNVSVETEFDPVVDQEGERTGKLVSIEDDREPLFLVRGIENPVEGFVKTFWHEKTPGFLYPGQSVFLREQEKKSVRLTAFGKAEEVRSHWTPRVVEYVLVLFSGYGEGLRQELRRIDVVDEDSPPSLIWAGDLDGDGKTDLFMDLTHHYNVTMLTLFLSSRARPGQIVGKAAEFRTVGC